MLESLPDPAVREDGILWRPSPERIERAQLTRYMRWLKDSRGLAFADYDALWSWSTRDLDAFWGSIWDYFAVISDRPRGAVLADRRMPGAQWFPGTAVNYAEHIFRDRPADAIAVIHAREDAVPESCTWAELEALTGRVRAGLVAAGVTRGDRVAALLPNVVETLALLLAAASLGAVFSCVSPEMGAASVLDRFSQIEPRVLVAADGYRYNGRDYTLRETLDRLEQALPSLQQTVVLPRGGAAGETARRLSWAQFTADPARLTFDRVPFDHPLWILYSSGTTGAPKAIVHSQGGILLEHLKKLHLHVDAGPGERIFWFTTTGWMMWNFLVGGLLTGASVVLYDGSPKHPDLGALWDVAAASRATCFGSSAGYLTACMGEGILPRAGRDLSALRSIGSTGSPLLPAVFDWIYESVGGDTWLFSSSGGTDVCTSFVGGVPILPVRRGELQARSLGASIEAWDSAGRPLIGEVGELVLTEPMPSMPIYFWADPDGERLRETYFDTYPGVWRHGDWVEITPLGGVVIHGRSDSTINRGGVRFGTSEIYQVVLADPDVVDALTVDVTRPDGSSWLPLFVVLRDGAELDDRLIKRIRAQLLHDCSPRHLPDAIVAIDEVPRTLSGKPLEVPVKRILMGADPDAVLDRSTLANPAALAPFLELARDRGQERVPPHRPAGAATRPARAAPGPGRLDVDEPREGVVRLTIVNPARRNALDLTLLDALAERVSSCSARCLIIRGAGDTFSAGYDLRDIDPGRFAEEAEGLIAHPAHAAFDALEGSDCTIIAQLNGAAIGGGLELAMCCDLRFASDQAVVGMPAGDLGLIYSHTGLRRFVEVCGMAATKELFLLGRRLSAGRAERLGILTEVVPAAELDSRVLDAASEIAGRAPLAQAGNKRILERLAAAGRALPPEVERELEALRRSCFDSSDLREGIRAFTERRPPAWTGD